MTYRRGLNRLYVILCGLWLVGALLVVPWYWRRDVFNEMIFWELQTASEADPNGSAHRLAKEYSQQIDRLSYEDYWSTVFLTPWMVGALIGVPVAVYVLLYAAIAVTVWVVRAFSTPS